MRAHLHTLLLASLATAAVGAGAAGRPASAQEPAPTTPEPVYEGPVDEAPADTELPWQPGDEDAEEEDIPEIPVGDVAIEEDGLVPEDALEPEDLLTGAPDLIVDAPLPSSSPGATYVRDQLVLGPPPARLALLGIAQHRLTAIVHLALPSPGPATVRVRLTGRRDGRTVRVRRTARFDALPAGGGTVRVTLPDRAAGLRAARLRVVLRAGDARVALSRSVGTVRR